MGINVLIVEDESRISSLLKMYFARESIQATVAEDGIAGLELALNEDFSIIILDVFLPGLNGLAVLEEVKKRKGTPVFMLTAQGNEEDRKRCLELGAADYILKPFSPGQIILKVKELVGKNITAQV